MIRMSPQEFGQKYALYYDTFGTEMKAAGVALLLQNKAPANPVYLSAAGSAAAQACTARARSVGVARA